MVAGWGGLTPHLHTPFALGFGGPHFAIGVPKELPQGGGRGKRSHVVLRVGPRLPASARHTLAVVTPPPPVPPKPPDGAPKECRGTTLPRPAHGRGDLGVREPRAESISCIVRIGGALLRGFVLCLLEQEGGLPRRVPPEELGGEAGEETAVASLRAATFRVWGCLSQDPEMDSLVGALAGCAPLPALAEVSEQLFQDGVNWGRVVVFFYFTYRVVRQALWGDHPLRTILDWAISFLQQRLSAWIQQQGGWGSILSYRPLQPSRDPRAMGTPEK
ncbi:apoptosis regulator BAX-like [Sarcoramphus papa]